LKYSSIIIAENNKIIKVLWRRLIWPGTKLGPHTIIAFSLKNWTIKGFDQTEKALATIQYFSFEYNRKSSVFKKAKYLTEINKPHEASYRKIGYGAMSN